MNDRTLQASLREVMAEFPTGVTIVAGRRAGEPFGLTVNSLTSVSLDPPLVLVCIARSSASHDRLVSAGSFIVNMLSASQGELATRFAREPSEGRFEGVDWSPAPSGAPILSGGVAWLDCSTEKVLDGGDHSILVGRVESSSASEGSALLFHRGRFSSTGE